MQTTSALYKTLLASKSARREVRVLIDCEPDADNYLRDSDHDTVLDSQDTPIGTNVTYEGQKAYYEEDIFEATIDGALFAESSLSFGGCVSRELRLRLYPRGANIPRMAKMEPQVRLRDGDVVSEWIPKGIFYIDTRETDRSSGILTLTGYDAMLKAEAEYISPGDVGVWPLPMSVVAAEICSMMGLEMDSRTEITDYPVELPTGYSMREVLSAIAAANAGNWIITDDGKLRLVRIDETRDTVNLGRRAMNCAMSAPFEPITHVVVNLDEEVYAEAGDDTGRTLEVTCPWGTEGMATAILSSLSGFIYRPYTAGGAILDPAAELGDAILLDGVSGILAAQTIRFNALFASDISSPGEDEIDHEYPYHSTSQREIKRRLKTITTTFRVEAERISGEITAVDGRVTRVEQGIDGISSRVEGVADSAVSSVSVYYALSDSESVAPVSGWSVVAPGWENGKFMWQKTVTVYGDGREVTSDPTCISGARGASQEAGYSTAIVYLYKRSLKAVTAITWDDTLTYHFPTQRLLSVPDGWSETIPSGDAPIYVTAATAYANTGSDTIAPSEWSTPVLLAKNGENGAGVQSVTVSYGISSAWNVRPTEWVSAMPEVEPGDYLWTKTVTVYADPEIPESVVYTQTRQGTDGVVGEDGYNSALVYLYKRFDYSPWYGEVLDSSTYNVLDSEGNPIAVREEEFPPSPDWTETLVYDFTTKRLVTVPEGWSDVPPEGTDPCYIITAVASSRTLTAEIPLSDWSAPVLFWRNGKDGVDGQPGKDGEDGRPGRDGADGTSSYIHIKYAPVPNPTDAQITDTPSEYIGICVTNTTPDPTGASWYTWTKWEGHDGPQGIPGTNGKDGTSEYVHFAYSTSADGTENFSVTSFPGAKYIGVCHDDKKNDPTTPASYEWTLIKGADGADGRGIETVTVSYAVTSLPPASVNPSSLSWKSSLPSVDDGSYLWIRTITDYTSGADTITYSYSRQGMDGENGAAGVSVSVSSILYQAGTSATTPPTGTWKSSPVSVDPGKYLWTKTTFSDGSVAYGVARQGMNGVDGTNGADGVNGKDGKDGKDGTSSYIHIKYSPVASPSASQMTDVPSEYIGICVNTTEADPTTPGSYKWSKWEGKDGEKGIPGVNGKDGTSEFIHFAYATSASGANFSTTPFTGATYLGVCHNDTEPDPTTPSAYAWSLMKGADGKNGTNGTNGRNAATAFLYQRKTGTSPTKPTNTLTYTFSTGKLTPADSLGSWSQTIPAANGNPCWVIQATAISTGTTDNITNSEWSDPVILAENGVDGVGVTSIVPEYYLSTSATSQAGGAWTTTCPDWVTGKYIWTRSHLYWEDGTETTTAPVLNNAVNGLGQKYTEVKQTADKIEWLVVGDSSTTFTLSDRAAKLVSDTIDLTGFVTFTDLSTAGKTTISGSNIKTGTIDANEVTIKNLNASNITSGTISADRISGGTIDASVVTVKNLDASKITSGELSASRISGGTLDFSEIQVRNLSANSITSGTLSADRISGGTINADNITVSNLNGNSLKTGTTIDGSKVSLTNMNASNLKSGSINASTIPVTNLDASNITTGSLSADRISGGTIDASKITVKNLSATSITGGTLDASKVTVTNLSADSIDTSGIKVKAVYGEGTWANTALISSDTTTLYFGKQTSGTQRISYVDICTQQVYFGKGGARNLEIWTDASNVLQINPATNGSYTIGTATKQFKAVYAQKIYADGVEISGFTASAVKAVYAESSTSYNIKLNSSKQFIPASSSGYYLGNSSYPFERLYLASNCYLSASSGKLAVNGTVIDGGGGNVSEIYVSGSTTYKIALNSSKDFVPSATGFSLGSSTYPFDEAYIGVSSSYYWKITEAGIIPSRTTTASSSYFNLGSSTYPVNVIRANKLYVDGKEVTGSDSGSSSGSNFAGNEVRMGGNSSYYIVANTSRELRPNYSSTTYPFYLGTSTYFWHYAYIGSNTAQIGSSGTTSGSKIGFYGTTPVVRQTLSTTTTNMSYTSATASNYLTILNNLVGILKNKYGLIA